MTGRPKYDRIKVRDITLYDTMGELFAAHHDDSPDCSRQELNMLEHGAACPSCGWLAMEPE